MWRSRKIINGRAISRDALGPLQRLDGLQSVVEQCHGRADAAAAEDTDNIFCVHFVVFHQDQMHTRKGHDVTCTV